jgi:hypothetical protein
MEVETDGFCMTDVEVSVGFRRESGDHLAVVFVVFDILFDNGLYEMPSGIVFFHPSFVL